MDPEPEAKVEPLKVTADKQTQLGLWGTPGSGKSTLVTMLYKDVQRCGWRMVPCNDASEEYLQKNRRKIRSGEFPNRTEPGKEEALEYQIYRSQEDGRPRFSLKGKASSIETIHLKLVDAAGEWWDDPEQYLQTHKENLPLDDPRNPIRNLLDAHGILCLVDAQIAMEAKGFGDAPSSGDNDAPTAEQLFNALSNLFSLLRRKQGLTTDKQTQDAGFIKHKIAFCISKVDISLAWGYRDKPTEWAKEYLPTDLLSDISNYCKPERTKWFGLSSVGTMSNYAGEQVSPVQDGRIIDPSKRVPYRLLEPIEWLLGW